LTNLCDYLQPLAAIIGIALAVTAQYLHVFHHLDAVALALMAAALVCWAIALASAHAAIETRLDSIAPAETKTRPASTVLVVSAAALALLTLLFVSDNEFNSDSILAWLGSIAVFLYAFWMPEKSISEWRVWLDARRSSLRDALSKGICLPMRALLLASVLLLGVFFCYHNLDGVPAELDRPHADKILDIDAVLGGTRPIYFEHGAGREPLDFYTAAAFVELSGHPLDFMAVKLVGAALGVLLVLATFLLARELFEFGVALAAAMLVAIGKWPVALARQGLAHPFTPLLLVLTLLFLMRALKHQRRNDFLMTGLFLGLGLYGSDTLRIAPLLVAVFLLGWYFIVKRSQREALPYLRNTFLLFALALIVALPLLRYAIDQPAVFWQQTQARLVGGDHPFAGNPAATFAANLWNAALMFNWRGDGAWALNVPGDPALDYLTGGLFVLGLAYALFRLARYRERAYLLVLIGLTVMLVPSALGLANPDENPSAVFAGGAIPFVFIIAALPAVWTVRVIDQTTARVAWGRTAAAGVTVLALVLGARANFSRYFSDFNLVYRQSALDSSEIATAVRGFTQSIGDAEHAWIVAYPNWVDARNVGIAMGQVGWQQTVQNADAALALTGDNANKLYVLNADDRANLVRLQEIFPNGQPRALHTTTLEHDVVLFYVLGSGASSVLSSQ